MFLPALLALASLGGPGLDALEAPVRVRAWYVRTVPRPPLNPRARNCTGQRRHADLVRKQKRAARQRIRVRDPWHRPGR